MKVFCYKHPNEQMDLEFITHIGNDTISYTFKCISRDCENKVQIWFKKELIIKEGMESL